MHNCFHVEIVCVVGARALPINPERFGISPSFFCVICGDAFCHKTLYTEDILPATFGRASPRQGCSDCGISALCGSTCLQGGDDDEAEADFTFGTPCAVTVAVTVQRSHDG